MTALDQLRPLVGMKQACQALSIPRATWYRRRSRDLFPAALPSPEKKKRHSVRALAPSEQSAVLSCLHEERFQDCSPAQIYAALLDEGRFHCSIRTMYRLLETHGESGERRDQLTHPSYQKPELLASEANQLWSWDITKLRGPVKWTTYHLYVILDVFSRYVVGWMIAHRESAELAFLPCAEHRAWSTYDSRRSRLVNEIQTRGSVAGRSRRRKNPQPPTCLR
jgi:putative transposase